MLHDIISYDDYQRDALNLLMKSGIDISYSKIIDPTIPIDVVKSLRFAHVHGLNIDKYLDNWDNLFDVCMLMVNGKSDMLESIDNSKFWQYGFVLADVHNTVDIDKYLNIYDSEILWVLKTGIHNLSISEICERYNIEPIDYEVGGIKDYIEIMYHNLKTLTRDYVDESLIIYRPSDLIQTHLYHTDFLIDLHLFYEPELISSVRDFLFGNSFDDFHTVDIHNCVLRHINLTNDISILLDTRFDMSTRFQIVEVMYETGIDLRLLSLDLTNVSYIFDFNYTPEELNEFRRLTHLNYKMNRLEKDDILDKF